MLSYLFNLPSFILRKYKSKKISFSLTSVDLLVSYIFKNQKKGYYIDVGCNHPVFSNNTYLLYKKGWRGINIDLDKKCVDLFNTFRKNDFNLEAAVSDNFEEVDLFFYHDKSAINTIDKKIVSFQKQKPKKIKRIKTKTLNSILEQSPFINKQIDFLSIDVEGNELNVIKGLNLKKYPPKIVVIEFLDLSLKNIEIKNFNIQNIINSEIYKYMVSNDYSLVNWVHSDLVFAHDTFK